jgi:hypothetical protein
MRRFVLLLGFVALLLSACDVTDLVNSPRSGDIEPGPTVVVEGTIPASYGATGVLTVNGVVTPMNADRTWSATVPSTSGFTTPVEVVFDPPGSLDYRQRLAVVNGPEIPAGAYSPNGVGMKFTDSGLAGLGPVVKDLAGGAFDIGGLLMSQNPIVDQENAFLHFDITGNVYEAGIGGVDIATGAAANGVTADIDIDDLFVGLTLNIRDGLLINMNCNLEMQIPTTSINGTFDLAPVAGDPSHVDVNMIGAPGVTTSALTYEFISGSCDDGSFLIGDLVNAFAGPMIQDLVAGGFATNLGDPDGAGPADSPIADAIETSLAEISIAGEVGAAVGVNLDAPFTAINESASGIQLQADADFFSTVGNGPTVCQPPAHAPTLDGTYDVPGAFPDLGNTTPSGDPFGLGLTISASGFNQLLGAMTECGIINQELTEITLNGLTLPVSPALLSAFDPAFATLAPTTPMKIRVKPTAAPFLTSQPGPNGEMGQLVLANLEIEFIAILPDFGNAEVVQASVAVDAPLGFELAYDEVNNVLAPTITPPVAADVDARVIINNIGVNEAGIETILPAVFPSMVGGLSDSFAAFPLPSFLGLNIELVDLQRQGGYFVIYANLNNVPQTRIENATITDLSSADAALDNTVGNSWEWRHHLRKQFTSKSLNVQYKGVVGADSIVSSSTSRQAAAGYRLNFDVVPENGETWQLNLGHNIVGAHTIVEEGLGGGTASSSFVSPVVGRVSTNGGASWQNFTINPNPASRSSVGVGAFNGTNNTVLTGTTPTSVIVEFRTDVRATSNCGGFLCLGDGYEGALRIGAHDSLTNNFTAGDYPGPGNRNIQTDGWFGSVVLSSL